MLFVDPAGGAGFRRNVNVLVQTSARPVTLDEYAELLRQIRELGRSTIGESRSTTLSGTPAYRVAGRRDQRVLSVWTVRGNKVWLVTHTADPARYNPARPEVERLVGTIQVPA